MNSQLDCDEWSFSLPEDNDIFHFQLHKLNADVNPDNELRGDESFNFETSPAVVPNNNNVTAADGDSKNSNGLNVTPSASINTINLNELDLGKELRLDESINLDASPEVTQTFSQTGIIADGGFNSNGQSNSTSDSYRNNSADVIQTLKYPSRTVKCVLCSKEVEAKNGLNRIKRHYYRYHESTQVSYIVSCSLCKKRFQDANQASSHYKKQHGSVKSALAFGAGNEESLNLSFSLYDHENEEIMLNSSPSVVASKQLPTDHVEALTENNSFKSNLNNTSNTLNLISNELIHRDPTSYPSPIIPALESIVNDTFESNSESNETLPLPSNTAKACLPDATEDAQFIKENADLEQHIIIQEFKYPARIVTCVICKKEISLRNAASNLKQHLVKTHKITNPIFRICCAMCPTKFTSCNQASAHFSKYHGSVKAALSFQNPTSTTDLSNSSASTLDNSFTSSPPVVRPKPRVTGHDTSHQHKTPTTPRETNSSNSTIAEKILFHTPTIKNTKPSSSPRPKTTQSLTSCNKSLNAFFKGKGPTKLTSAVNKLTKESLDSNPQNNSLQKLDKVGINKPETPILECDDTRQNLVGKHTENTSYSNISHSSPFNINIEDISPIKSKLSNDSCNVNTLDSGEAGNITSDDNIKESPETKTSTPLARKDKGTSTIQFPCKNCTAIFGKLPELKRHAKTCPLKIKSLTQEIIYPCKTIICTICKASCRGDRGVKDINQHYNRVHKVKNIKYNIKCSKCPELFSNCKDAAAHSRRDHKPDPDHPITPHTNETPLSGGSSDTNIKPSELASSPSNLIKHSTYVPPGNKEVTNDKPKSLTYNSSINLNSNNIPNLNQPTSSPIKESNTDLDTISESKKDLSSSSADEAIISNFKAILKPAGLFCPICKKKTDIKTQHNLQRHIKRYHPDIINQKGESDIKVKYPLPNKVSCPVCIKEINYHGFNKHCYTIHPEHQFNFIISCSICEREFSRPRLAQNHYYNHKGIQAKSNNNRINKKLDRNLNITKKSSSLSVKDGRQPVAGPWDKINSAHDCSDNVSYITTEISYNNESEPVVKDAPATIPYETSHLSSSFSSIPVITNEPMLNPNEQANNSSSSGLGFDVSAVLANLLADDIPPLIPNYISQSTAESSPAATSPDTQPSPTKELESDNEPPPKPPDLPPCLPTDKNHDVPLTQDPTDNANTDLNANENISPSNNNNVGETDNNHSVENFNDLWINKFTNASSWPEFEQLTNDFSIAALEKARKLLSEKYHNSNSNNNRPRPQPRPQNVPPRAVNRRPQNFYDAREASRIQRLYRAARKRAFRQVTKDNDISYDGGKAKAENYFTNIHGAREIDINKLNNYLSDFVPRASNNDIFVNPFSNKEVINRLKRMSNTSPGPDKLEYRHLKAIDGTGRLIALIFNKCREEQKIPQMWKIAHTVLIYKKGDSNDPSNFRPIALQSCLYKLFVALLSDRLAKWADKNNLLSDAQKGFRQGEGCYEHTFLLQSIVKDARNNGKNLSIAWLDLQNAFGSVPHSAINTTLKHMGLPDELLNLFGNLYDNSSSTFQTNEGATVPINILAGVKQGCPLSPILFNLTLETLLRAVISKSNEYSHRSKQVPATIHGISFCILAYADDLVLVSRSSKGLQTLLDVAGEVANVLGLLFKPTKCATLTLTCRGGTKVLQEVHKIQAKNLPSLKKEEPYRYLGVPVGINVAQHEAINICKDLIEDLVKVKDSLLAPWQKLDCIRTFFQPRLSYILRAGEVHIKTLNEYRRHLISTLKSICCLPKNATNDYFFARQSAGGLGLQDPKYEVHIQALVQGFRMLNCRDNTTKTIARSQLNSALKRCLKRNLTNNDLTDFLSGSMENGLKNYQFSGNVSFLWARVRKAAKALKITFTINESDNYCIEYSRDRIQTPGSTLAGSLRELVKDIYVKSFTSKPDQGKVARALQNDKFSNGSSWLFTGNGIRFCDWRFIHRARLNLLPLNNLTARWYPENGNKKCRRCPEGIETLPHVIDHCQPNYPSITRRHNLIVNRIVKATKSGQMDLDKHVPGDRPFLRPDIVFYDDNKAAIIDVCCPFDNGPNSLHQAAQNKVDKYQSTRQALLDKGYQDVVVLPFVVGALGTWYSSNEKVLTRLGISKRYRKLMRKLCCTDAIKGSRDIYVEHVSGHRQY